MCLHPADFHSFSYIPISNIFLVTGDRADSPFQTPPEKVSLHQLSLSSSHVPVGRLHRLGCEVGRYFSLRSFSLFHIAISRQAFSPLKACPPPEFSSQCSPAQSTGRCVPFPAPAGCLPQKLRTDVRTTPFQKRKWARK